jgi:hypothetical protein
LQPSHDFSFLQEIKMPTAEMNNASGRSAFFIIDFFFKKPRLFLIIMLMSLKTAHT